MKLQKAKPREKAYRLSDDGGLYVLVQPTGAIWWRYDYTRPSGGRNTMSLGTYPKVSLKQVREKHTAAQADVAAGIDPVEKQKAEAKAAKADAEDTFEKLSKDFIADQVALGRSEATISKLEWLLLELAAPLASRAVRSLIRGDMLRDGQD